jgi:type I restriction enzyme S subunit
MSQVELALITSKIGSGATPRGGANAYMGSGPITLIRSQNVRDEGFDYSGLVYITDEQAKKLNNVTIERDDVLLNITGDSVARVSRVPKNVLPARVNQHVAILRPDPKLVNPAFLYYSLSEPKMKQHLLSLASTGATRNALTKTTLEKLKINLPDMPVQLRVAEILSAIDKKIELNRRMNKTLEQIGQLEFEELIQQGSSSVSLEKIINFNPRESLSKGTDVIYLEMKNLSEVGLSISRFERKSFSGGTKFRNGDTLLARITPCLENGKTGYVDFLSEGEVGFGSTEYIVMRPDDARLDEYVYHLARSKGFRAKAIQSMVGTSGRQRVQTDSLRTYKVPILTQEQIEEFHQNANARFKTIKCNSKQIHALSALRDSLLPRLISGSMEI